MAEVLEGNYPGTISFEELTLIGYIITAKMMPGFRYTADDVLASAERIQTQVLQEQPFISSKDEVVEDKKD